MVQALSRKRILTPDEFTRLKDACRKHWSGRFTPKQELAVAFASFHDAFALDIPDQCRSRILFGQHRTESEPPFLFSYIKLNPNPAVGGNVSPFDYALLFLLRIAFPEKDIQTHLPFRGAYLLPVPEFARLQSDLLQVHNAFSLASWSGGSQCEGPLFDGIQHLFELSSRGPLRSEIFQSDPQLAAAIAFLKDYAPIREIVPLLADAPSKATQ